MNDFLSMLVPLETLPGWPKVQEPTALDALALLVGAPLVVIVLIAVLARVHHAVKGNAGVPPVANQPIWVNGRQVESSTQDDASRRAIDRGYDSVSTRSVQNDEEARGDDDERGGAGARW